jgi:hypothetical protein
VSIAAVKALICVAELAKVQARGLQNLIRVNPAT